MATRGGRGATIRGHQYGIGPRPGGGAPTGRRGASLLPVDPPDNLVREKRACPGPIRPDRRRARGARRRSASHGGPSSAARPRGDVLRGPSASDAGRAAIYLGAHAEIARERTALRPDQGPCFQGPSEGEVVLGGRKLVGSAQVRFGTVILQHGSVILRGDQSALVRAAGGVGDPRPPATLDEVTGAVAWSEVARELAEGMRVALGGGWKQGGYESRELSAARRLEADRYATDSWTWRR
jgi:hypothetical protein